jgi:hypothetical protein
LKDAAGLYSAGMLKLTLLLLSAEIHFHFLTQPKVEEQNKRLHDKPIEAICINYKPHIRNP